MYLDSGVEGMPHCQRGLSTMRARASARTRLLVAGLTVLALALASLLAGCGAAEEEAQTPPIVADGEHDPAVWGAVYPQQYARWLATAEERPAGKSAYKRGFDGGVMYDKLSEFPFMPLLFNG
jgi:nitrite reductase (cytochrome c-552)